MSIMRLYEQTPMARAVKFMHAQKRATLGAIADAAGIHREDSMSLAYLERNLEPERVYRVDGDGLDAVYAYQPQRAS